MLPGLLVLGLFGRAGLAPNLIDPIDHHRELRLSVRVVANDVVQKHRRFVVGRVRGVGGETTVVHVPQRVDVDRILEHDVVVVILHAHGVNFFPDFSMYPTRMPSTLAGHSGNGRTSPFEPW